MKLEIFIIFVISFELTVRISSAVIERTKDCGALILYDDRATMTRSGDRLMLECSDTGERWYFTCQDGDWIGNFTSCGSIMFPMIGSVYCSDPVKNENELVFRRGDRASVQCLITGASSLLLCVNGEWKGERGICSVPNCPELTYDENVYEIIPVRKSSMVVKIVCRVPNPDGRRKAWYIGCRDDRWLGYVGECDGRPQ